MAKDTYIQWTDSDCSPVAGCAGCELWTDSRKTCYAGVLHERYAGHNKGFAKEFLSPQEFPGRMATAARWPDLNGIPRKDKPWIGTGPRLIFVSHMGDALSPIISFDFLRREIVDIAESDDGSRHRWQWLTKQARRMRQFSSALTDMGRRWPSNLWAMTSVTSAATQGRAVDLKHVGDDDTIRGISFEPIDTEPDWDRVLAPSETGRRIRWAIFGGESGPEAREMDIGIIDRGVTACRRHGVAPFVKQLGKRPVEITVNGSKPIKIYDSHGGDWGPWPDHLRVRELP